MHLHLLDEEEREKLTGHEKWEHYAARLTAMVVRTGANGWKAKPNDFYVKYDVEKPEEKKIPLLTREQKLAAQKARFAAFTGTTMKALQEGTVKIKKRKK